MNYGTIVHAPHRWLINCEPHVRAHLKRVFPRADAGKLQNIALSDTAENSRNLLWFLGRYPMDMAEDVAALLNRRAQEHVDTELRLAELLDRRRPPESIELAEPAREYQLLAADMVRIRGGLLLADDVGLGKSISAMLPMAIANNLPAVVVCPAHMPNQWAAYLARFLPALRVHKIKHGTPYPLIQEGERRQSDLWPERLPDVIVISYHKLRSWAATLAPLARYAVFDECQQLRHVGSEIYRASNQLAEAVQLRMGLSATPIYNYGSEFYPVINALLPDALGSYEEFIREWCVRAAGDKPRLADTEQFGTYLRREGIMLRRTRADVGRELPPLTKVAHEIEADESALKAISGDAVALARVVLERTERYRGERLEASGRFEAMVRQATGIAKAPYVAEFVRILIESGQPVVLFGWHRGVYNIWAEKLADLNPQFYTGEESATQKDKARAAFIGGDSKLLIMSLRSGAGVDGLQGVCSTVVFGELDWSPGVHEQCIGRIARDGQTLPTMAYFLTTDDGCDPIMIDVLGVKREQIEGVRNPGEGLIERIETGEDNLKRLATEFLRTRGVAIPASNVTQLRPATKEVEPA